MRKYLILLLICVVFSSSGCYALRKKFIRKKKYKEDPTVYVDFKKYPDVPSDQAYIDYYLFVRGWIDELTQALKKRVSFKRQKRSIEEILMNIEQMMACYNQEGKDEIYPLYEDFLGVRDEVIKAPHMSELKTNSLIKRLEHFKRKFESDFNYTDAKKWIE
jgi:hypothetical protein